MQHVAAGKYARHARLQTLVHYGAARTWVQLNARAHRKLVFGYQTHRKQQRVARNDALRPGNGRQVLVDLTHLDGLHAVVSDHARDGGGQVQRNAKVVQAVLHIAAQAVGVRHEFVHALDRNPLERAAARHDESDVTRAQNDGARAGFEVLDIDVSLRQARRKHAGRSAAGNLDLAAGALAATHGKDDRAPGELQHTGGIHERDGVKCGVFRGLARINPKHHAIQEQRNVGRAHLVDKALRILGTGELLLKVRKAKTGMNALAEDAAQVLLALNDGHARAGLMRRKRGRHAGGPAADNDHVEGLRWHGLARSCNRGISPSNHIQIRCHPSAPPSKVPQRATSQCPPTAPRWGHTPARGLESPPRGSGKSRSGSGPCRHGSGA